MLHLRISLCCAAAAAIGLAIAPIATAQAEEPTDEQRAAYEQFINSISWTTSGSGTVGSMASIQVPEGFRHTGPEGSIKLMEAYGNLTSGGELAFIAPDDLGWFALFEFDECGYVKDDEKDKLDAAEILDQLKQGQEAANAQLSERGMSTLELTGWHTPPFYNPETKNLEWAIRLRSSDGDEIINYKTKVLGRRGVMDVVLVCGEDELGTVVPVYQKLLSGFSFNPDDSYAAFRQGDKIAEYGLTGLIVGGTLLAAAKSGLLTKLWKPIALGLVAVGAVLKRIFVGKTREIS